MSNEWQGEKIRLRALEADDWETFFRWNQDTSLSRALDYVWPPGSSEHVKQWLQETMLKNGDDHKFFWVIETLAGEIAGSINSHTIARREGTFSYGVAVLPQHQRQGYAREAIDLLLRYFFFELRYQKVNTIVFSFNAGSIALHERLGFQLEGRLRRMGYTQGEYFDHLIYGLTKEEYTERP